ncbi:sensor histidine kinase [Umezawaea tangerina]|uniref:histidine kinase n=1 Tax=Umezawaea tangerina TaxID=84725 RepID=A0A2T0THH0_9PSEU|nr:histidine kinase [Umezawaea tangerina]PRY45144.1 signal transduction histidine kinase [Umezawaea tangerina]
MTGLLRSLWDEPRPALVPPVGWRDRVLVGVLAALVVVEGLWRPDLRWPVVATGVALVLVPLLLVRRSRPLLALVVAFVVTGLSPLLTGGRAAESYSLAFVLLLVFSVARWGSGREVVLGLAVVVAKVSLSVVFGQVDAGDAGAGFVVTFSAVTFGAALRYRAGARVRELDRVKLLERGRLARDLHDTVAHHVSAIAIRAQAGLATAPANPDAAVDALRLIEAEASRALVEMRTLVHVLRQDQEAELAPTPRVSDLERLATGGSRSGPSVDVGIDGDVDDLPPTVGTAIYRLAQESVTNARRHARHATRIVVRVAADDTSVRLRVSDDGDATTTRPTGEPGYGLIGMIERAGLLGGTCEAGPDPDRGWTVTAVLPRAGAAG